LITLGPGGQDKKYDKVKTILIIEGKFWTNYAYKWERRILQLSLKIA
jgi:hypothetical protein